MSSEMAPTDTYEQQAAAELDPLFKNPYYEFSEPGRQVMTILLKGVIRKYEHMAFHNQKHSIAVPTRGLAIWSALQAALPQRFTTFDAELLAIGGVGHDLDHEKRDPHAAEELSGALTTKVMKSSGYDGNERRRVHAAITATSVASAEDGSIVQDTLRSGNRDPLKLVLAMADINGIALGGISSMINDATNLFMEHKGLQESSDIITHVGEFGEFLTTQARFLRTRLKSVDGDIDYYFVDPHENAEVKEVFNQLFQPGHAALAAAEILEAPGVALDCVRGVINNGVVSLEELRQKLLSFLPSERSS